MGGNIMARVDQVISVKTMVDVGTGQSGDVGFFDFVDISQRTIRVGLSHLDLPKIEVSIDQLQAMVAKERRKHGKDIGARVVTTKNVRAIEVEIDQATGAVLLRFAHAQGTSTFLAVPPNLIDDLTRMLRAAKADLPRSVPRSRTSHGDRPTRFATETLPRKTQH